MRNYRIMLSLLLSIIAMSISAQAPSPISNVAYELSFNVPENPEGQMSGTASVTFFLAQKADVTFDFKGQFDGNLKINGKKRKVEYVGNRIILPKKRMKAGANKVELSFSCANGILAGTQDYIYTLPLGNEGVSQLLPCLQVPDLKAVYNVNLKTPDGWHTICNASTQPMAVSQLTFMAGKFSEQVAERDGRTLHALYRISDSEKVGRIDKVLDEVAFALSFMEGYTGVPHPLQEYPVVILPAAAQTKGGYPWAISLSDQVLDSDDAREDITRGVIRLWFGGIVAQKSADESWANDIVANFLAWKITTRQQQPAERDLAFLQDQQARAMAIDHTPAATPLTEAAPTDELMNVKSIVMMRMLESIVGADPLQNAFQSYLQKYNMGSASWEDLVTEIDSVAPGKGASYFLQTWVKQKGVPTYNVSYQNGKLNVQLTDGEFLPQKFIVRLILDMGKSQNVEIDMTQPTLSIPVKNPSYIIPNATGVGYGRFTMDNYYTEALPLRLIVTRDLLQRYALLLTLHDQYMMGRLPASYFGELYRNMLKERDPLVLNTTVDHMFKIAFDGTEKQRQTLELCMMDLLPENRSADAQKAIIRKMAANATSPEVLKQLDRMFTAHAADAKLEERDFMQMAYRLALLRPAQWQQIISNERNHITVDSLHQEFDYVSRACNPDASAQRQLFTEIMQDDQKPLAWKAAALRLLSADIREQQANAYIGETLDAVKRFKGRSLRADQHQVLHALLDAHKSSEALNKVMSYLEQHPELPRNTKARILAAAWYLRNMK